MDLLGMLGNNEEDMCLPHDAEKMMVYHGRTPKESPTKQNLKKSKHYISHVFL